jgi:hypothetical protein
VTHQFSSACDQGDVYWFDSCGGREEMKEDCTPSQVCAGGACCTPESARDLCGRLGKNCDEVTALDNCGQQRTVNCGDCDPLWTCGLDVPNVCGCHEDDTVCAEKSCGEVVNNCGRTVNCGTCLIPECCDYKCYNTQTDRNHCGNCITKCLWDEVCSAGKCSPQQWELVGGGIVNPGVPALGHALGTDGSSPYVAWTASEPAVDGGASSKKSVLVHQLSGGIWKQVGLALSDPVTTPQGPVDIQFKGASPLVLFVENNGNFHVKAFNANLWTEVGAPGYGGPCMMVNAASLALDAMGVPHLTSIGAGGCGIGVGYSYFNANLMSWWQTPQPPAPMPGLITMNGAGVSDVVHDGSRALVAMVDKDLQTSAAYVFVKWWNTMPPNAWTDIGGPLNSNPLPQSANPGFGLLSMTLTPGRQPMVAFVEVAGSTQIVTVKAYDPVGGVWISVGGGKVSGSSNADSPSLALVDGVPHVAYVETDQSSAKIIQVMRLTNNVWERVGAPLNAPPGEGVAPYLVGVGKVPHVAYRVRDAQDRGWIHVMRFIAPAP